MIDALARIEELCAERNWTFYRLAREADISDSTFRKLRQHQYQPSQETVERCCKAFGITMAEFYANDPDSDYVTEEELEFIKRTRRLSAYWKGVVKNIVYVMEPASEEKVEK